MISIFGGRPPDPNKLEVVIERPSQNSRRISATVIVERSIEEVWHILTDYNNLSTHVPNLVKSKVVDHPKGEKGGIRLFQEGAQKIIGFDFSASLTMDMTEIYERDTSFPRRSIQFKLVESRFFSEFDGQWQLQVHSRRPIPGKDGQYLYSTRLTYEVVIAPNGPVPVLPLEWRIREDVPLNLIAVKEATEKISRVEKQQQTPKTATFAEPKSSAPQVQKTSAIEDIASDVDSANDKVIDWESEETLGPYIRE